MSDSVSWLAALYTRISVGGIYLNPLLAIRSHTQRRDGPGTGATSLTTNDGLWWGQSDMQRVIIFTHEWASTEFSSWRTKGKLSTKQIIRIKIYGTLKPANTLHWPLYLNTKRVEQIPCWKIDGYIISGMKFYQITDLKHPGLLIQIQWKTASITTETWLSKNCSFNAKICLP